MMHLNHGVQDLLHLGGLRELLDRPRGGVDVGRVRRWARARAHDHVPHALCGVGANRNRLLVTHGNTRAAREWPVNNVTFRGTSMPADQVAFFEKGRVYRCPMMLATSFSRAPADFFLRMAPPDRTPVLFRFWLDPDDRCDHALYIEALTTVSGEEEFLYTAYSAFRVRGVKRVGAPSSSRPVEIDLDVFHDNKGAPEDAPLAAWH